MGVKDKNFENYGSLLKNPILREFPRKTILGGLPKKGGLDNLQI